MSEPNNNDYLEALEVMRNVAAVATGVRTELIAQGWTEKGAEEICIAIMRRAWSS